MIYIFGVAIVGTALEAVRSLGRRVTDSYRWGAKQNIYIMSQGGLNILTNLEK